MARGKATGKDLAYQRTCRDVWIQRSGDKLRPYRGGDGIDVPLEAGGTTWTLDIVLEDEEGNLHVAEAKRVSRSVPQGEVRKFAGIIEDLRQATGRMVTGIFFAKTDAQSGALGVAEEHGVQIVRSREDQPLPNFEIALLYRNPQGKGRKKQRATNERTTQLDTLVADAPRSAPTE